VTFKDSNWLLSIVLAHQGSFRNQPEGVQVFWATRYSGPERRFVPKAMATARGRRSSRNCAATCDSSRKTGRSRHCNSLQNALSDQHVHAARRGDRPLPVPARMEESRLISSSSRFPLDYRFHGRILSASPRKMAVYQTIGNRPPCPAGDRARQIVACAVRGAGQGLQINQNRPAVSMRAIDRAACCQRLDRVAWTFLCGRRRQLEVRCKRKAGS